MRTIAIWALIWLAGAFPASAQSPLPIPTILAAMDHICQRPDMVGVSRTIKGSIQGTVSVKAILKKLADAGVSAQGEVEQRKWEGISQADMAKALADSNGCAERMFTLMFTHSYSAPPSPSKPKPQGAVGHVPAAKNNAGDRRDPLSFEIIKGDPSDLTVYVNNLSALPVIVKSAVLRCFPSADGYGRDVSGDDKVDFGNAILQSKDVQGAGFNIPPHQSHSFDYTYFTDYDFTFAAVQHRPTVGQYLMMGSAHCYVILFYYAHGTSQQTGKVLTMAQRTAIREGDTSGFDDGDTPDPWVAPPPEQK